MFRMKSSRVSLFVCVCLAAFALLGDAFAQKEKEEPRAVLNFLILKEDNGKPIRSAAVVMHEVSASGKQGRGDLELKTDADGKTSFEEIPYGRLRVQVIASGFQTYGEDYTVDRGEMNITIKLKRPQSQYSIYGNQPQEKPDQNQPPPNPNTKPQ
jgi:hypothetical protein